MTAIDPVRLPPGTHVRATIEGAVSKNGENIRADGFYVWLADLTPEQVEVLAPPRPSWADTPGEVVHDRDGGLWGCGEDVLWQCLTTPSTGAREYDALVSDFGPLTRLVPEVTE